MTLENNDETITRLAKDAYDAYCQAVGGKSAVTGDPLPAFEKTNEMVQRGWKAVITKLMFTCPVTEVHVNI